MDKPALLGGEPVAKNKIPFTRIALTDDEINAVMDVMKSRIFVNGEYTKLLEREFARYIGVKHAIAVSNGTDALFLIYLALDLVFGSRIVTTPVTFIATASTILHAGGIPLFVDVKPDGNIDPEEIKKLEEDFSAITVVHLYGKPVDMDEILRIARERGCFIIEDAAHAHGAEYNGRKVGSIGDVAAFSLYPAKIIAAGGWGGIVTTNSDEIAEKIRLLRAHGELRVLKGGAGAYEYVRLGYNMRISEIEAAVAYYQLKKLDRFVRRRREIAKIFSEQLSDIDGIITPSEERNVRHAYYIYCILLDPKRTGWTRDLFVEALNAEGISARKGYPIPLHKTQLFKRINDPKINHFAKTQKYPDYQSMNLPTAELITSRMVWLPLYPEMTDEEAYLVTKAIRKLIEWRRRH